MTEPDRDTTLAVLNHLGFPAFLADPPSMDVVVHEKVRPSNTKVGVSIVKRKGGEIVLNEKGNPITRVFKDPSLAKFQRDFRLACAHYRPSQPWTKPLGVWVVFYRKSVQSPQVMTWGQENDLIPNTIAPDYDNLMKTVGDALNGQFWADDKLINWGLAEKKWAPEHGARLRVWVRQYPEIEDVKEKFRLRNQLPIQFPTTETEQPPGDELPW